MYRYRACALGEPLRQRGQELDYRCSNHPDQNPSLRVNQKKNVWMCGPRGKSGGPWALVAFLSGREPSDKPTIGEWLWELGLLSRRVEPAGSGSRTVATYDFPDEGGNLLSASLAPTPCKATPPKPERPIRIS